MAGNLKIRTLGNWSLGITAVLAILCIAMSILGFRKYEVLQSSTRDYIACEAAAQRFQTGSDTLTRQVRLAAATGEQTYIDAYFEEANVTRSRETALADLSALHGGEDAVTSLEQALSASTDLMQTEYYAMRLVEEAIRRGIVRPLLEYNESIRHGVIAPIHGAAELRALAETYNSIYEENEEREILMKHQAEHDSLTELLNRRSFDQILSLYEKDRSSFALILADVDVFKQINDTCGHDTGDRILKRVAALLHTTFRSIDYVCRIGGDEFAVIMVDMSRELYYTITDKIAEINGLLAVPEDGLPAVSLSAGVAFSDENGFCGSLFRAADSALYTAKAHGRCGCSVSPAPDETGSKS
jgi:diguanylate cyclase (GGDEF)-like protein